MKRSEPVRRTAEIEEITNLHLIHPAASRLVPLFARLGVKPNAVSLLGMLFGVLGGAAYCRYQDPRFAVAGFVLMVAWHIMDGADGQLARLTHSQSRAGQVLDGIADSVTFLAVYVAFALALARRDGAGMYALVAGAAVCHAVQAAAYETQRHEYESWGWGRGAAAPAPEARAPSARAARPRDAIGGCTARLAGALLRLYYGPLGFPAARVTRRIRSVMAAALDAHPDREELIRRRYREAFAPLVRAGALLSANYRTLGIFIAALLQAPQYYFGFEIVGFSAILALLIRAQSARCTALQAALGALEEPRQRAQRESR